MIMPAKSLWGTRYQAYGGSFHTCCSECSWGDIVLSSEFFCSLTFKRCLEFGKQELYFKLYIEDKNLHFFGA